MMFMKYAHSKGCLKNFFNRFILIALDRRMNQLFINMETIGDKIIEFHQRLASVCDHIAVVFLFNRACDNLFMEPLAERAKILYITIDEEVLHILFGKNPTGFVSHTAQHEY